MTEINIHAVSETGALQGHLARGQAGPASSFTPGQQYVVQVIDATDAGSVLVSLQGVLLNLALGEGLITGQLVTLKFLGSNPIPTFLVVQTSGLETQSSIVDVSPAGVEVAQYLEEHQLLDEHPRILETKRPLLSLLAQLEQSAQELKQAIACSGLFYESHLADYALGKFSLEQLLQEPQNAMNFEPAEVVAKQLDVYEHHSVRWAGTVWPGQLMQWDTKVEPLTIGPDQAAGAAREGATITSTLELDLPNLKKISVRLSLYQGSLKVAIQASDPFALEQLKKHVFSLTCALSQRGQTLESCLVSACEQ
jgi:hypothetical protein